ncbi:MAG: hypothetical protein ABIG11_05365, partial [bacterium]
MHKIKEFFINFFTGTGASMSGVWRLFIFAGFFCFVLNPEAMALNLISSMTVNGAANNTDAGHSIVVEGSGNVYVLGTVQEIAGTSDIWIGKYNSSMVLLSSTVFNDSADGYYIGCGIATDSSNNIWVTGSFNETQAVGGDDIWIAKYNSSLVLLSSRTVNGSGNNNDRGQKIAVDLSGNIWVTGSIYETAGEGLANVWIAKYNPSLVLLSSTTIRGSANNIDCGYDLAVDSSNNIWIAGYVFEAAVGLNILVAEYNSSMVLLSSRAIDGSGNGSDTGYGISIDSSNNILVTGMVTETVGGSNLWIAKYNSSMVLLSSITVAGSQAGVADYGRGITTDSNGNIWVTGIIYETVGGANIWIAGYNSSMVLLSSITINGSVNAQDEGHDIAVDSGGNIWTTGYVTETVGGSNIWIAKCMSPTPPSGLSAESLAGNKIALSWTFSPSDDVAEYRLYYDAGSGTIDYDTPFAVFSSTTAGWTTGPLASGVYKFGIRAKNCWGIEEQNTSVFASAAALSSLTGVRAAIKVPQTGKRITGNRVTIVAELILGDVAQTRQVLFQYRLLGGGAWTDIPAASVNNPNPDLQSPYFVHWDVDALGLGAPTVYELRAVATDISNNTDSTPPSITVVVDPVDYDISETLVSGKVQKEQKINNAVSNTVQASDVDSTLVARVEIPSGALNTSTVTVTVVKNHAVRPAPPQGATDVGVATKIDLSNSQSQLSGGKTATLTLNYDDDDGD